MQNQHKQLASSLWKSYTMIMMIGGGAFVFLLIILNFSSSGAQFPKHNINYRVKLQQLIQNAQITAESMTAVIKQQIQINRTLSSTSFFCNTNLTYSECQTLLMENRQSKTFIVKEGTSNSFRCLHGNCETVSALWDYLWLFKLRLNFIDSILIDYEHNMVQNTLIVPALAIQTVYHSPSIFHNQWNHHYSNQTLKLFKQFMGTAKVQVVITFNTAILERQYGIQLKKFDFTREDYPKLQEKQVHFEVKTIVFLAMIMVVMTFVSLSNTFRVKKLLNSWADINFKNLQALDSLYRYQLNSIFSGKKPHQSSVLSDSSMSTFYEELSQIIDKGYVPLTASQTQQQKEEPFKFITLLQKIKDKFSQQMKIKQQQRNRQLSDIKYQIKGAVSQITDSVSKRLKEAFGRARQLHLSRAFFYYGYLALLEPIAKYQERFKEDSTVLPQSVISLFRYMNQTINSQDLKFAFKFASMFTRPIEEELLMRLQYHLQQKYLVHLKQLDFGLIYCKQLRLEKQIKYLQQGIDNKKYIFIAYLK